MAALQYPPPGHILRKLGIALDPSNPGEVAMSMPVTEYVTGPDGSAALGAIATMADLAAGVIAVREVAPDWTATFELTIHHLAPAPVGTMLEGVCRTVRAGRHTVVSESNISAEGTPVAYSEITYIRFPRPPEGAGTTPPGKVNYRESEPPLDTHLTDLIGFRAGEPGIATFDLSNPIRNSFGTIQGGMTAVALEHAALSTRPGRVATFLHVYYLAAAKSGPYQARAVVHRDAYHAATCRVDLTDIGHDRLVAQGTAIVE